ncbi:hypothetical protein M4D49_28700 [Cupriavidus pauculus]|jgi:hypothetical protein|uniref:hypothetical protein n=1 Tax=Cupriavidus TaxID=106589 RepID=UPI00203A54C1|nr:hypothetical protein [Cupriavidus pauculus]MCM3609462.1 hypothetical protein [Cupriavidus pauculus]
MDKTLEAYYAEILATTDPSFLDPAVAKSRGLSTPFLVSGPKDPGVPRIMVIGREFGGKHWHVNPEGGGVNAYVAKALNKHREFLEKWLAKGGDSGTTFFNFLRALADKFDPGGLIYSNLFCIDAAGGDPSGSEHFPEIKRLSKLLLDAQFDRFQPDVVIFAHGSASAATRREFFPTKGLSRVCVGRRDWEEVGIPNMQLWEFELYGKYLCYRIQHPANWRGKAGAEAATARRHLLDVLTQTLPKRRSIPAR